jgi:hypothetical protein
MNKLKKEALKVIAANLPMDEITGLKEMFHSMDKDGRCAHMAVGVALSACAWALQGHLLHDGWWMLLYHAYKQFLRPAS